MEKEISTIITLLTEIIESKSVKSHRNCITHSELEQIIYSSVNLGVAPVLFPFILKEFSEAVNTSPYLAELKDSLLKAALFHKFHLKNVRDVLEQFYEDGISPLVLKGISISNYYIHPEFRFMSDLDLYVRPEEWSAAVNKILKMGYVQTEEDDYNVLHIKFEKPESITIELHRNMIHFGYLGNRDSNEWYRSIWINKKKNTLYGVDYYSMSTEDELIHQVTHFAAHFVYIGTQMKHLFEIALLANSNNLDWDYIKSTLIKLKFYNLGILLFSVCKKYFNVNTSISKLNDKDTIQFLEDFIQINAYERNSGYTNIWIQVLSNIKPHFHLKRSQLFIWIIVLKAQLKKYDYNLRKRFKDSVGNIEIINKKIKIIKSYVLET